MSTNPRYSEVWCRGLNTILGNCTNCHIQYTGENCEHEIFYEDLPFMTFLLVYQVGFMSFVVLMLLWIILGILDRKRLKYDFLSLYGSVLVFNVLFILIRSIHFVDPYGFYKVMDGTLDLGLIWLGVVCITTSTVLCIAIWFDIVMGMQRLKRDKDKFNTAKTITYILGGSFFVLCMGTYIIFAIMGTPGTAITLMYGYFFLVLIALLVMAYFVLPRLFRLKAMSQGRLTFVCSGIDLIIGA